MEERTGELRQLFIYEHDAKRLELLVRIGYGWICIAIVLAVYGFVAEICLLIQWFVILILGRRSEGLSTFIRGFMEYYVHVWSYTYFMTDQRPGILPKKVEIYEKLREYRPAAPPSQPPSTDSKFCSSCGEKLDKSAKFCSKCGHQQPA